MNKTVYKYSLQDSIELPKGAEILKIGTQNNNFVLWALVDPTNEKEWRTFQLIETGNSIIDHNLLVKPTYIGSTEAYQGRYVLHVFENVKL